MPTVLSLMDKIDNKNTIKRRPRSRKYATRYKKRTNSMKTKIYKKAAESIKEHE